MMSNDATFLATAARELSALTARDIPDRNALKIVRRSIKCIEHTQTLIAARYTPLDLKPHREIAVFYPKLAQQVLVDEELVPLVKLMWHAGCDTLYSCQGQPGGVEHGKCAYFMFENGVSVDIFMKALEVGGCEELVRATQIKHGAMSFDDCELLATRFFSISAHTAPFHPHAEDCFAPFRPCVYFSHDSIKSMTRAFRRFVNAEERKEPAKKKRRQAN